MAERTYTVTLKITRTYARKVAKGDKLDAVTRAVRRALPEGWTVEAGAINLCSTTARTEARASRREAKRRREVEERARAKASARDAKRADQEAARREARRQRDARKITTFPDDVPEAHRSWVLDVFRRERMVGWDVLSGRDECWSWNRRSQGTVYYSRVVTVPAEPLRSRRLRIPAAPVVRRYLEKRGCAVDFVHPIHVAILHDVAHVRRYRATRGAGDDQWHGHEWRRALLNLLRKYESRAFTKAAQIVTALRGEDA